MKKAVISVMLVLCVALLVVCVLLIQKMDNVAPEISVPDTQITYTEGDAEEKLLEGVTAFDEKDGDVSDSLQVEAIHTLEGNDKAVVVYVAKDKSNNIATKNRTIDYIAKTEVIGIENEEETEETPEQDTEAPGSGDAQSSENDGALTIDPAEEEEAAEAAAEAQFANLSEESPRMTLYATRVLVSAGGSFTPLSYVKEITDNKDERDDLFRKIQIVGDYDLSVPGTYELVYYVIDSDENQSNEATLTLIVQ